MKKNFVFNYYLILDYDMRFSLVSVKEISTTCSLCTWTFNRNVVLSESED